MTGVQTCALPIFIIGIGNVSISFGNDFELSGIALGSIVAIVAYHLARLAAPKRLREPLL